MTKIDIQVISDWWDDLDEKERDEAWLVLEVLSDNDSTKRAWLQIMTGYFGARFVLSYLKLVKKVQSSEDRRYIL